MTYLHELVVTLAAPWVVLSARSGQLTGTGAEGVFAADHRILSVARLSVGAGSPVPIHLDEYDGGHVRYDAVMPGLGDSGHDPTVTIGRRRELSGKGMRESIEVVNRSKEEIEYELIVALGTDLAGTAMVRSGAAAELLLCPVDIDGKTLTWNGDDVEVAVTLDPAPDELVIMPNGLTEARWHCRTSPGESSTVGYRVALTVDPGEGFTIAPPRKRPRYHAKTDGISVECDDLRVGRWVERSLDDVAGLMLSDGGDRYLGAGPPWYLTLFGRDSLISASMLVAVDPGLAAGTLRALARWQGTRHDTDAAEQPGKIPHELRGAVADHGSGLVLPPAYYGTHDATPLWITTLHKAWRWGMPAAEVEALLPAVERALSWIRDEADPDGDGFLEYIDTSGHGLANQGWKDSVDAVQWPDGTLAEAPIALSEVQAYAYAAALAGADLLTAFGRPADKWREWAAALKERFRDAFWVEGYPAIALDAHKRPVAGAASNMGHLLGTGLLDPHEEAAVAHRLSQPDLDSGYGLRTLSSGAARFNPLGYHTGSVWPHDTAIAITGLYAAAATANAANVTQAESGHAEVARSFVAGLTKAAEAFAYRLPELYDGLGGERTPTPYPLACRPQAWAAASAIAVVVAALGIEPDVPAGVLRIAPADPFPWRQIEVHGLRIGDERLSLRVDDGQLTILAAPKGLTIQT